MEEDKKPRIKEGPPIWVESLMSANEWKDTAKKYGYPVSVPPPMFECEFKWRWKMGGTLTADEIKGIDKGIEVLRKLIRSEQEEKQLV